MWMFSVHFPFKHHQNSESESDRNRNRNRIRPSDTETRTHKRDHAFPSTTNKRFSSAKYTAWQQSTLDEIALPLLKAPLAPNTRPMADDVPASAVHAFEQRVAQQQQEQLQEEEEGEQQQPCGFSRVLLLYVTVVVCWGGSFYAAQVSDRFSPTPPSMQTSLVSITLGQGLGHIFLTCSSGKDLYFFLPRWEHFRSSVVTWALLFFTFLSTGGFICMSEVIKS